MSKKTIAVALVLVLATAVLVYNSGPLKQARFVKELVARNIDVRGGPAAWEAVNSLRLSGKMDLGQGMVVPYVLEQKRPGKMCFRFEFDDATSIQCAVGFVVVTSSISAISSGLLSTRSPLVLNLASSIHSG